MANDTPPNSPISRRPIDPLRPNRNANDTSPGTFATISLEDVETMLGETPTVALPASPATTPPGVPPPLGASATNRVTPTPSAAPQPATPSRFRFGDLVLPDGRLDIERIYKIGRVPDLALSSERLLTAMSKLPPELPLQVRRTALKVTFTSIIQASGESIEVIIADAQLRHTRIQQFADGLIDEQEREMSPLRRDIQELEETLAARKAELIRLETIAQPLRNECVEHIAGLDEVIAVLTSESG